MKKSILLSIILVCLATNVCAQSRIYVTFTSTNFETKGVWNYTGTKAEKYRDPLQIFTFFDRAGGNYEQCYFYRFVYQNLVENASRPFFYEKQSFLDIKNIVDWDLVASKSEAKKNMTTFYHMMKSILLIEKKQSILPSRFIP